MDNDNPLALFIVDVVNDMRSIGYTDRTYEDWLGEFVDRFGENQIVDIIPPKMLVTISQMCGVRMANDPLVKAWLDGIEFYVTHEHEEWFQRAIGFYEAALYDVAAKVFIEHGYDEAYCCKGLQQGCPLDSAMKRVARRQNN